MSTIVAIYFAVTAASLAIIGYLIYDGIEARQGPYSGKARGGPKRRHH